MTYALPADRSVTVGGVNYWTAHSQCGYPGGIPAVTTTGTDVKAHGAKGDGNTDDTGAFKSAIANGPWSASTPKVLYIPAGTYKITDQLDVPSGIVFRGAGSNVTKIVFYRGSTTDAHCFDIVGSAGSATAITGGATKGSNQITVSSSANFSVGTLVELKMQNDSAWNTGLGRQTEEKMIAASAHECKEAKGEMAIVSGKNANTLTLDHALFTTLDMTKTPQAVPITPNQNIGFEYLCATRGDGIDEPNCWGCTWHVKYGYKVWWQCVESWKPSQIHWIIERSYQGEVRQCYLHDFWLPSSTGEGYGFDFRTHSTSWLFEDNCADDNGLTFCPCVGSTGNVFGYNYVPSHKLWDGIDDSWAHDEEHHGFQAHHNLTEGNVYDRTTMSMCWGATPYNVIFRNRIKHYVGIYDYANNCSVIGNEIWNSQSGGIYIDTSRVTGTFKHGNEIDQTISWDSSTPDHVLPASFYYTSKPSWWGDEPWPAFGPALPAGTIPAETRYNGCGKVPQP